MDLQNSKQSIIMDIYNNSTCENNFLYLADWNDAIIGYSIDEENEFTIVYDEELIIKSIVADQNCSIDEAYEYYSHIMSFKSNKGTYPLIINSI